MGRLKKNNLIAGKGGSPGQPYEDPEKGKGPFVPAPGKKASKGSPLLISSHNKDGFQYYDDEGRPVDIPPYSLGNPGGQPFEVHWLKEDYYKDHERRKQLHLDRWHNREQLLSKAANNIRKFKRNDASYSEGDVKGHSDWAKNKKNRYKLATVKAKNNIRRLQDSGHMTIQDPDNPKRLKIIDLLGPQV